MTDSNISPIQPGTVDRFQITGNTSAANSKDMSPGITDFRYYESIFSNNITATAVIAETGFESDGSAKTSPSAGTIDSLPIRGGERTDIDIKDSENNRLKLEMYVNRVRNADPGSQQDVYWLDFSSKESFANEQTRVVRRYDGRIDSSVEDILKNVLKYSGKLDIDPTALEYNFIGNDRKPFKVCTWLASKAVPADTSGDDKQGSGIGGAAGFLFYQTRDSMNFKSIDRLFLNKAKVRKYIHNNGGKVRGYDGNILKYTIDRDIDLKENLVLGTYNNRTMFFNPVSLDYFVRDYNIGDQKDKVDTAGKKNAAEAIAKEFSQSPSRIMTSVLDVGTLPAGVNTTAQLEKWKARPTEPNYKSGESMVQSAMRYNQMQTIQISVVIAGDYSIKAGDLVKCDFQKLDGSSSKEINPESSGIYMIANVCHKITPSESVTSLGLIRDSYK